MEIIPDKVQFPHKQSNMPKMSSTYAIIHAAQDLIYAIQNPSPAILLGKLGNLHKEALISLAEISRKAIPPAGPPRVPIRGA